MKKILGPRVTFQLLTTEIFILPFQGVNKTTENCVQFKRFTITKGMKSQVRNDEKDLKKIRNRFLMESKVEVIDELIDVLVN